MALFRPTSRPRATSAPETKWAAPGLLISLLVCCALTFVSCSSDDPGEPPESTRIVSAETMMGWIRTIFDQGVRLPGYPANDWAIEWVQQQFENSGLQEVTLEPIQVDRWESSGCSLSVRSDIPGGPVLDVPCMPVPYSQPSNGIEAELIPFGPGAGAGGRIALVDHTFIEIPAFLGLLSATGAYDPLGDFGLNGIDHMLPFSFQFQNVLEPAIEAGAVGFIGVLSNLPWDTEEYFVPYDAVRRPLSGVWISASNGDRVKAQLAAGRTLARISYDASVETVTSYNVYGSLPGVSDDWIIIGTHHDGPWGSAVEDGSGMALVLAQVAYWSKLPGEQRPHNMLFLMNGGHMAGGKGIKGFVANHAELLESTVAAIHLEHVARKAGGADGLPIALDEPEIRWWFTSRNEALQNIVLEALEAEDLYRSILFPPDFLWFEHPPTDGAFFHPIVPIVQHLSAPVYLFDSADTPDMVHEPSLVPLTRAVVQMVNALGAHDSGSLRVR